MDRAAKEALVTNYNSVFTDAGVVVVTHYAGLSVSDMDDLRKQMAEVGASVKVIKNRLVKLAAKDTPAAAIADMFTGPTAIAFSDDPIAAPRIVAKFAEQNDNLVILGGVMDDTVLDAAAVKNLASLPSLDELRAQIVGLIQSPATKVATVLAAPAAQLARVMAAYAATAENAE